MIISIFFPFPQSFLIGIEMEVVGSETRPIGFEIYLGFIGIGCYFK